MNCLIGVVLFSVLTLERANSLQCWRCSSDILPECRDHFNQSEILARRGGGSSLYDSLQQNYQQGERFDPNYDNSRRNDQYFNGQRNNQRQYDPNYPAQRQYDQGNQRSYDQFNPNQRQFGQNFNPSSSLNNRLPELETCDENEARLNRKRSVCLKEVVRGNNYVSIIRRCESIPIEQTVGTCQPSVNRGLQLDFCEYCDYDGCNAAAAFKMNMLLAIALILSVPFLVYN